MTGPAPGYRVEVTAPAKRDLAALKKRPPGGDIVRRVDKEIVDLATDPCPPGSIELTNSDGIRRIVVGDYRILYQVDDASHTVTVAEVGHRREVYRSR